MGRKLIIDTDPGVDDAFAIALAALNPNVDLLGLTTVFGNVPLSATTANARRLLALCGREDVPVAAGASRPLVFPHPHRARYAHGADGLSGRAHQLPEPSTDLDRRDAVGLLFDLLDGADEPVTLVPVGPLTNIALLLAAHPGVRDKIDRLVIMGGALAGGNTTAAGEFNIWSDPEAARRVLVEEDLPTVLVPMDLTYRCAVDTAWLAALAESGPVGAALTALTPDYLEHYRAALGWDGIVLHDAVAVGEAIQPGLLRTENMPVDVECSLGPARGMTVIDKRRKDLREEMRADEQPVPSVDVATDADIDEVRRFVLTGLTGR